MAGEKSMSEEKVVELLQGIWGEMKTLNGRIDGVKDELVLSRGELRAEIASTRESLQSEIASTRESLSRRIDQTNLRNWINTGAPNN